MKRILSSLMLATALSLPAIASSEADLMATESDRLTSEIVVDAAETELLITDELAMPGIQDIAQANMDVARRALSLGEIYSRVSRQMGGGRPINTNAISGNRYLIRWQTSNGQVLDLVVDGNSGQILRRT